MSLDKCLEDLREVENHLDLTRLIELSGLTSDELEQFIITWKDLESTRKLQIVNAMVELAEDSAELDFSYVFRSCLKDTDDEVREKAIAGLWEEEDRNLIPELIKLLENDHIVSVRSAAATALGKFIELDQSGKLLSKDSTTVKESLMNIMKNENENLDVRRRSLEALAPLNTTDIKEYIEWAYTSDDVPLKCSAIYAMGHTGETEWLPFIVEGLTNVNPPVQYESANACGMLGEEEPVPHLISLLEEDDLEVQRAAIKALGEIGGIPAQKALKRCLEIGDISVEEDTHEALNNIDVIDDTDSFNFNS